jgi:hypothetical protein
MISPISLSRAELYAHGDCAGDCEGPDPESLGVEVLDVLIVDGGVVTIAARAAPPEKGGNYIQINMSPDNARRLALLLLATANIAEVTPTFDKEIAREAPQLKWN